MNTDDTTPPPRSQPRNPLHGLTLEAMLEELVAYCGWATLARQVPINCFRSDPSIKSSLTFLRKTPWAREKVESFYLYIQREKARNSAAGRSD